MADRIILTPESFETLYLMTEDNVILTTESGKKIIVDRIVASDWIPYRIYDYERDINENKRNIKLVDRKYLPQISKELETKIK